MLTKTDESGRVTAKGQVLATKNGRTAPVHVPEHVVGHVNDDGLFEELPNSEKTFTSDDSPVFAADGSLIRAFPGLCID